MLLIIFLLVCVRLLFSLLFLIVNSLNMSSLNMVIRSNVNVKRSGPGRDFTSPYSGLVLPLSMNRSTAGWRIGWERLCFMEEAMV